MQSKSTMSDISRRRRAHARVGDDPLLRALGDELRAARAAAGLSQAELALAAGVGRDLVIGLENGRPGVAIGHARRVAGALGLRLTLQADR
jgi:DNA-binding XRE family transcriptional regulator